MKKRNLFCALAAGMAMFSACSSDNDAVMQEAADQAVQELILQVANGGDRLTTRAGRPLYSQEAKQSIENVKLIICNQADEVVYVGSIGDWNNTGSTPYTTGGHGREAVIEIPAAQKLAAGSYKVYAVGYHTSSDYSNLTTAIANVTKGAKFTENTLLTLGNKVGEEIFAGSLNLTIEKGKGFKTPIVLNRQVAGTFGYVRDVPALKDAAKLRLVSVNRNTQLVLGHFANFNLTGNGTGNDGHINYVVNGTEPAATENIHVIYEINLADWFTDKLVKDDDKNGLIDETNWQVPVALQNQANFEKGSFFGGNFLIPFAKGATNTFELQLLDKTDNVLRTWVVKLPANDGQLTAHALYTWNTALPAAAWAETAQNQDDVYKYNVVRNHLYGIGTRSVDKPTNPQPGPNPEPQPEGPDTPVSLNNKQELVLQVNDNWEVIHGMELE